MPLSYAQNKVDIYKWRTKEDNYEQTKLFDEKYHKIIDKQYIQSIHE